MNKDIAIGQILNQIVSTVCIGGDYQAHLSTLLTNWGGAMSGANLRRARRSRDLAFTLTGDQPQLTSPRFGNAQQYPHLGPARRREINRCVESEILEVKQNAIAPVR